MKVSGTDWTTNQGKFKLGFWLSQYADDAATSTFYDHLCKPGLPMNELSDEKRSKTEAICFPARNEDYGDSDTPGLALVLRRHHQFYGGLR